ncbi:MAG: glycosyltransferase [Candidatus Coproplasma sp.]
MDHIDYLLTIAIPTYNGSKTITKLLDILTPQLTDDIEVLISDNCSTDITSDLISGYIKKYNIRYIRNEVNIGPDANFLQCMLNAKGKYTFLISDDDIIVENAICKIREFLIEHPTTDFAYLETVGFKEKYIDLQHCHAYNEHVKTLKSSFLTNDKKEFMKYAIRHWGFLSSYLWRTERTNQINNVDEYKGTYWLQAYINIDCCKGNTNMALIKGPIIAAGQYKGVNNFDVSLVDGIYYRKMIEYAISNGFNKSQLRRFYLWRICFLGRNAVIKEKIAGIKKTSKRNLFILTYKHLYAWLRLYPYFFVPMWLIKIRNKVVHYEGSTSIKREE